MKLTIKNYEKQFRKEWDDKNYNEDIIENGYYTIGKWSNESYSVRYPYWIKHEDIMNMDSLMDKLKLMTDEWTPKLI